MGRPPKANRDEIADITLSFRFTPIERKALERLAQRRSAELRGSGATVTATSLGRAIVRKELDDSGVYAEVEREHAGQSASPAPPAQAQLPGLGDVAPEPRRTWGTSSPAAVAPLSAAPQWLSSGPNWLSSGPDWLRTESRDSGQDRTGRAPPQHRQPATPFSEMGSEP